MKGFNIKFKFRYVLCYSNNFFAEPPNTSPQMVWFDLDAGGDFNTIDPENLMLKWDPYNLTMNLEASVTISLWGYRVNIQT